MDETQIDSYLYAEMAEDEREKFEDRFIGDDELFAEIAGRENDLVDAYVRGELSTDQRTRFERSLDTFPARREKLKNAELLREFIATERQGAKTITIAERSGYFAQLAQMMAFRSPAFQFASIGLILLLAIASLFLLRENRRLGSLETELAASRQRVEELAAQTESAQGAAGDLTEDLAEARARVSQLETEIEKRREPAPPSPMKPTIATMVLSAAAVIKGGSQPVQRVEIPSGVERVATVIILDESPASGAVSVRLNGEIVAKNVRVQKRANGESRISVTIQRSRLSDTRNELTVYDASDNKLGANYVFSITERK